MSNTVQIENNTLDEKQKKYPKTIAEAKEYSYNFWKNKPVTQFTDFAVRSERIEDNITDRVVYSSDIPITLPNSMKWVTIDFNCDNEISLDNIAKFLRMYYSDKKFKKFYTADFIKWLLGNNGFIVAIVTKTNNNLCGIAGVTIKPMIVFDKNETFGSIQFLCSHPIYRKKKIAFTLIDETVRRTTKMGIKQGYFTTELCVPTPTTVIRDYYRPFDYIKLQKCGFLNVDEDPEKIQRKFYIKDSIPDNCIPMTSDHIHDVYLLYKAFVVKFNIYYNYSENDLKNILLGNNHVKSYVFIRDDNVIDFTSYYELTHFSNENPEIIKSGYLLLYTCNTLSENEIMNSLLRIMKVNKMDLLTVNDTMMISEILLTNDLKNDEDSDSGDYEKMYEHKFIKGNKKVYFNFFNWRSPTIKPKQLSINVII